MTQTLTIHPKDPQPRLLTRAVEALRGGALALYPTDSGYAFGWAAGQKDAQERVERIRKLDGKHNFTVICRDLSAIALYAKVSDPAYRLMRKLTPGPYTFILPATKELPRRLHNEKRKSIGIRVPDHPIALGIADALGEPLMSSSLLLPDRDLDGLEHEELFALIERDVDLIVDGGHASSEPTTVLDLLGDEPVVLRQGRGPI
jgi:tRNA threonylcarbamoyl adenosine modification protein (Sua5/YciO/YrdC/YwlC family)